MVGLSQWRAWRARLAWLGGMRQMEAFLGHTTAQPPSPSEPACSCRAGSPSPTTARGSTPRSWPTRRTGAHAWPPTLPAPSRGACRTSREHHCTHECRLGVRCPARVSSGVCPLCRGSYFTLYRVRRCRLGDGVCALGVGVVSTLRYRSGRLRAGPPRAGGGGGGGGGGGAGVAAGAFATQRY